MTASTFKTYKMHGRDFVNVITKYRELYEQLDKETDDMVYGIFTEELPEYAYALQIKLEVITPEEERYQIASIMHPGGLLTIPYLVPRNSILVLSIYDKEAIRRSVQ